MGSGWRGWLSGACGRAAMAMGAAAVLCVTPPVARAHETDQYTLPVDRPFADMGHYFDGVHCLALERVVEGLNRRIDRALREFVVLGGDFEEAADVRCIISNDAGVRLKNNHCGLPQPSRAAKLAPPPPVVNLICFNLAIFLQKR